MKRHPRRVCGSLREGNAPMGAADPTPRAGSRKERGRHDFRGGHKSWLTKLASMQAFSFTPYGPSPSNRLARGSWSPKIPSSRALSHGRSSRLLSSMTSGRKSSSSPLLRRVRMLTPSRAPLMPFCSGFHCRRVDPGQFEYLEPAVDRVGYGFGLGHLFPNHIRL